MGSTIRPTYARRKVDHTVSSSWEVMERPVRIGTAHSDSPGGNHQQAHPGQNRAQYVATQPNPGDVMASIASEFEMRAQRTSSQRNSIGGMSDNVHQSRHGDVIIDVNSGQLNTVDTTPNTHTYPGRNPTGGQQDQIRTQRFPDQSFRPVADSSLSENETTLDRVALVRNDSQHSCPADDRQGSNLVRQTRTSQLRNTLASHNRDSHMSPQEPELTGSVDRNISSVSGGSENRARRQRGVEPEHDGDTAAMRFNDGNQQDPYPASPSVARYEDDLQQKTLLDLMTRGFRTFTMEMADVLLDKLKPENECFARRVGQEVKQATNEEIKQLRDALEKAEARIKELEADNASLQECYRTESDNSKKEMEKEILKRAKLYQEQSGIVTKLDSEVQKLRATQAEKEKLWRKAELKAKAEEKKRLKIEEDFATKIKDMQKQLDKVKGDLLVQKSVRRLQTMTSNSSGSRGSSSGTLVSHHGKYKKNMTQYVKYDEGDD